MHLLIISDAPDSATELADALVSLGHVPQITTPEAMCTEASTGLIWYMPAAILLHVKRLTPTALALLDALRDDDTTGSTPQLLLAGATREDLLAWVLTRCHARDDRAPARRRQPRSNGRGLA